MNIDEKFPGASREEILSALFAQMVLQQTNMAMMLLGKIANPQTGESMHDPDAASFFIDQLDMLEAKTRGNLSKEEAALLKQSLTTLRMTFVEAMNQPAKNQPAQTGIPESPASDAPAAESETSKKFTKKY